MLGDVQRVKDYVFRYGDGTVSVPLDETHVMGVLHGNKVPPLADIPAALNAALDGLEGCVYKPIALLGTQIVAGTNYCFLCETTVVAPDAQPSYALVYVFDGLSGEHEILRVQEIEFSAFE